MRNIFFFFTTNINLSLYTFYSIFLIFFFYFTGLLLPPNIPVVRVILYPQILLFFLNRLSILSLSLFNSLYRQFYYLVCFIITLSAPYMVSRPFNYFCFQKIVYAQYIVWPVPRLKEEG